MNSNETPPSVRDQQFEHLTVEQMTAKAFVGSIVPVAVEDAERPAQVPHRPAPTSFLPEREYVAHPRKAGVARGLIIAAPFANMNWYTLFHERLPLQDQFPTKLLAIPLYSTTIDHRPGWLGD